MHWLFIGLKFSPNPFQAAQVVKLGRELAVTVSRHDT